MASDSDFFLEPSASNDPKLIYDSQVNLTWVTDYPTISLVLWQNYLLSDNTSYYDLLIDSQPASDSLLYTVNTSIDLSLSHEFFLRLYNGSSSDERNFDSDIFSIVAPASSTSTISAASGTITSLAATSTGPASAAAVTYVSPTTITAIQTEYITPTASPSPTASSSGLTSGAKAGIGAGIGIGVPLLLAVIFLSIFVLRRRRKGKSPPPPPPPEPEPPIDKSGPQELDQTLKPSMHELDQNLKPMKMHELEPRTSIQNLAEMDARNGQAELQGSGNVTEMP